MREVTDEMVEALCIERYGITRWEMTPETGRESGRAMARLELRAALAVMPSEWNQAIEAAAKIAKTEAAERWNPDEKACAGYIEHAIRQLRRPA